MSSDTERLESIRRRIRIIRDVLDDPTTLSEIAIDGISEKVDRAALRAELRELEEQEDRLTGRTRRAYRIGIR